MEALLVRKKSGSIEALNRAAEAVDQNSIIGVRKRRLIRTSLRDFHGVFEIHLFGKGNITKKFLFLVNSPAAKVISWSGMEIGISA